VWRSFQRSQAQVSPVMLAPEDLGAVTDLFGAISPVAQMIDFLCQDPRFSPWRSGSSGVPALRTSHTLTASISLEGSFDHYWKARPKGLRQTIARSLRRAEAEGAPVSLRSVESPEEIGGAVREFGLMESRGWKGAQGTAVNPENAQGRFYAEVFEAFARTNQAIAYELYAGDLAISRQLALTSGSMCITLKTTHEEAYRHLSPGRVLDYEMLRLEFERRRFDRIELYTDADQAQLRWTTSDRWIEHVSCFRSSLAQATYTIARSALTGLRRLSGGPAAQPGNS
jgi:CelD/BcsL family acetyltransferase involved in cellulose biosynthesis